MTMNVAFKLMRLHLDGKNAGGSCQVFLVLDERGSSLSFAIHKINYRAPRWIKSYSKLPCKKGAPQIIYTQLYSRCTSNQSRVASRHINLVGCHSHVFEDERSVHEEEVVCVPTFPRCAQNNLCHHAKLLRVYQNQAAHKGSMALCQVIEQELACKARLLTGRSRASGLCR